MDQQKMLQIIAKDAKVEPKQAKAVIGLLEEGNTVPFIARYRKEMTGSLDEVQIKAVEDRYHYIQQLETRKEEVLRLIDEQGKLTEELQTAIQASTVLQRVEDLYRPFKQKRRTKATIAKERGLEPLAEELLKFTKRTMEEMAIPYLNEEQGVTSIEEALAGARDILAERFADDAAIREKLRTLSWREGKLITTLKNAEKDEKQVFEMYYEYEEPVHRIAPHRILAVNRGEKEEVIRATIEVPIDRATTQMENHFIPRNYVGPSVNEVKLAVADSYKRLIKPSIENELRAELSSKAETQAIHIFSENLRNLLLQPPMRGKMVLGVDPAYRTGCKLAVVDETGKMIEVGVIYPHTTSDPSKAKATVKALLKKYPISIIAIGNGTASRETEQFIAELLKEADGNIAYVIVNEAGASVYSASEVARAEFPDLQVEQRSAVSIARRLQDPLSELVKIDPKAVGVGQYQHDVSQKQLAESLTFIVETAVNQVGVDVNTASASLLQYVSGLSKTVAENIVIMRSSENGQFTSRAQLKKIPRLGAKTYEQAVGFLRIADAKNPLDATGIHPESYKLAEAVLEAAGLTKKDVGTAKAEEEISKLNLKTLGEKLDVGEVTLKDIVDTLMKPTRDPRDAFPQPLLKTDVLQMDDLQVGMELQGTVRNVVDFGAFVDIGVKQDGLVHISKLQKGRVKHPLDVVSLGDIVTVWVEKVEANKGRISLTMLTPENQHSV